jgi:predicted AAA+ superfamily ATPase
MNGQELNIEAVASDCAVPPRTVREYIGMLEDTMIAQILEPWKFGKKRTSVSRGKLYFFDQAFARTLAA